MNPNMIFNMGRDRVKPKPVARLFEPLQNPHEDPYLSHDQACGSDDDERFKYGISDALEAFGKLGTFAERNRKEKKECFSEREKDSTGAKKESVSGTRSSNSQTTTTPSSGISQPGFEIGDLVECLPLDGCREDRNESCRGKTFAIESFKDGSNFSDVNGRIALFVGNNWGWPLRALRHAETEPRKEDWAQIAPKSWCSKEWRVYKLPSDTWIGYKLGTDHRTDICNSWITLQRAMEAGEK